MEWILGGNQLVVKSTEEKQFVLDERAAEGKSGELVVQARNLFESLEPLLDVVQAVQYRIVFVAVDAAMPGVGAGLGNNVDHGTGIAAIFGTELIGHGHILLDKLGVRDKQAGPATLLSLLFWPSIC